MIPVHPAVTWNAPILTLNKEKMVLIYEDVVLQQDADIRIELFLRVRAPQLFPIDEIFGYFGVLLLINTVQCTCAHSCRISTALV